MKKIGMLLGVMFISTSVMALDCAYTSDQQMVRDAEILDDIEKLPKGTDINASHTCGGNLLQLAILRGNPDILRYLFARGGDAKVIVSLKGYEIPGAPEKVPLSLFAARYAPVSSLIDTLIEYGADMHAKDSNGHDIFWYFEQNPVLRNSYLTKRGYAGILPLNERIAIARAEAEAAYQARKKEREEKAAAEAAAKAEELAKNPPRLVPVRNAETKAAE